MRSPGRPGALSSKSRSMAPMPGVFPDYEAPTVRAGADRVKTFDFKELLRMACRNEISDVDRTMQAFGERKLAFARPGCTSFPLGADR